MVCKLKKSLHGMKQALRNRFSKMSIALQSLDYQQNKGEYSIFTLTISQFITVVLVYVDNLLISRNYRESLNSLKHMLSTNFHVKDLGDLHYFLGLEIHKSVVIFFIFNTSILWISLKSIICSKQNLCLYLLIYISN